jgi:hypothetical protein
MAQRVLLGTLLGAVVSFALVAGYSEIVRTCGRPSWLDTVRGEHSNVVTVAPGNGIEAPYGLVCDYFPSTVETIATATLLGFFFLVGGGIAGLIANRSSWLCGGGAAMLAAILVATPPVGRALAESSRLDLPVSGLIGRASLIVLAAALIGTIGGAVVARLRPNTSLERTREG